jgi:hypothetical protein
MTVITKQRSHTIEEMEKLLLIWINDNTLAGNSVSEGMVCEEARRLHDEPVKNTLERVVILIKLKKISGIPSVLRHGEAVSAN